MAYGSKATVEENLRGRRCNRKDQNNSAGLTRGTIQFVMWNHGVSAAQWERSPETWHRSQHVNSQELVPQLATLWLFITCKLSNHKSVSTPMRLHRRTGETHKQEMMFGVLGWFGHWRSLGCHAPLGEQLLSDGSDVFSLLWWTVVAAGNCWTMLIRRWRNKLNDLTHCAQAVRVSWGTKYCIGFSSHCNRLQGLMREEETVGHKKDTDHRLQCDLTLLTVTSLSIKRSMRKTLWLINWPPASYSQTITSSTHCTWICFNCNTSTTREPNIHFPLINSQFIPLPLPISLPFIMHYSPFLNDFLLTVSSNLVFGYG